MAANRRVMNNNIEVKYGLLVHTCQAHGISRTVAYKLASKGILKTFNIGKRRYVMLDSLHAVPHTIAGIETSNNEAKIKAGGK